MKTSLKLIKYWNTKSKENNFEGKIEYQPNIRMFVGDCDNFIEKKSETNYDNQFKINKILNDEIKRK